MSVWLATFALALVAVLAFAALTSLAVALTWPALRRRLRCADPVSRARWALRGALAPSVLPLLLLGLCLAPGFASRLGWHEDHCLRHAEHAHLCFAHPTLALSAPLVLLLGLTGALALAGLAGGAGRLLRASRELAGLRLCGRDELAPDVRRVQSERPLSVTLGLWRPEIWISSALADALPRAQLEVVVAHERAHARRRDSLWRLLARVCSLPHWPAVRRALLAEQVLASEQACDEAAGRAVGDRLAVAETILAVERLLAHAPAPQHPALSAFGGSAVEARVQSLLGAQPAPQSSGWFAGGVALFALALLADPLHHATEHVLGLLLRLL